MTDVTLYLGDCLERMREIPDASVSLIVCDPPYHRVKSEGWDRQWKTDADYLAWVGRLCGEWRRVLRPNGSLYCFASPRMAARVECKVGETFEVLNRITWRKPPFATKAEMFRKEDLRTYFPASEAIIFAEPRGSDDFAHDGAGWKTKCDEAARDVFGLYVAAVRSRHGLTMKSLTAAVGAHGAVNHGGACSNWENGFNVPTREYYDRLQAVFPGCFDREYEDLRREYEDLRRPFAVSSSVPYTDVWDFPTVPSRPGKHPCQKPLAMLEHIVRASSRPGDTVLDSCMGSGVAGVACVNLGRAFIGIDSDPRYFAMARRNIDAVRYAMPLLTG